MGQGQSLASAGPSRAGDGQGLWSVVGQLKVIYSFN